MNIRHPDGLGDAVHPLPPLQGEKRGPGRRAVSPGTCQHLLQVEDGFQRPVSTTALKRLPFPGRAPSRPKQEQPWGQSNRSKMRPAGWADARRPLVPRVAKVGWVTVLSRTSVSSEPTTVLVLPNSSLCSAHSQVRLGDENHVHPTTWVAES